MEFVKDLSPSEAKYKYVGLSKSFRETMPEKDELFDVKFRGKIYASKVNAKDCIMISQFYPVYEYKEGDTIKINNDKKIVELSIG